MKKEKVVFAYPECFTIEYEGRKTERGYDVDVLKFDINYNNPNLYKEVLGDKYIDKYKSVTDIPIEDNVKFRPYRTTRHTDITRVVPMPYFEKPIEITRGKEIFRISSIWPSLAISENGTVLDLKTGTSKILGSMFYRGKNRRYIPIQTFRYAQKLIGRPVYGNMVLNVLLAWEWCPNDDYVKKYIVDHIDENPKNDRASNLQWLTNIENTARSMKTVTVNTGTDRFVGVNLTTNEYIYAPSLKDIAMWMDKHPRMLYKFVLPRTIAYKGIGYYITDTVQHANDSIENIIKVGIETITGKYTHILEHKGKKYFYPDIHMLRHSLRDHDNRVVYTEVKQLASHAFKNEKFREPIEKAMGMKLTKHTMTEFFYKYLEIYYDMKVEERTKKYTKYTLFNGYNTKTKEKIFNKDRNYWAEKLGVNPSTIGETVPNRKYHNKPINGWLLIAIPDI